MRSLAPALLALAASPALAQQVADCVEPPPVTALIEPWEETTSTLGAGAIRLALLHGEPGEGARLLVLTLPPVEPSAEGEGSDGGGSQDTAPVPPQRRCRIVTEGGPGFALLDVVGEVVEDPQAGTLTARLPGLRFIPESSALEEVALVLTFGVADGSLLAEVEVPDPSAP
jgi:hypothetical protein